jgi:hypothetical protein
MAKKRARSITTHPQIEKQPAREGSWWTRVPQGGMTEAAERERERMSATREARSISSANFVGLGSASE